MLGHLILMLILALLFLYSYISTQNQFTATASAIRQIWSGDCHLSCRQSKFSGFSGLSSLQSVQGQRHSMASQNSPPGNSRECACESCPCSLIENFLRSWRPPSNMYSQLIQCAANCVSNVIQRFVDAYNYFTRVLECNSSCQRQVQLVEERDKCDSNENFRFSKDDKAKIAEKLEKIPVQDKKGNKFSMKLEKEKESMIEIEKNLNLNKVDEHPSKQASKEEVIKLQKPEDTQERKIREPINIESNLTLRSSRDLLCNLPSDKIIPTEEETKLKENLGESAATKGVCSKCKEKGRTCVKECPKAKVDKSK